MNTRKYIRNLFLIAALTGFIGITSCDKLEAPYATIKSGGHDTTDTSTVVRKVLLEDYTGHTCVNCPTAAQIGELIEDAHEGRVILISVHAGYFARPLAAPYDPDFRTSAGTAWNNEYGFASYPNGLINRMPFGGSKIVSPDQWETNIASIIDIPPDAGIKITCSVDTNTRTLTADVRSKFVNQLTGNYNLTLCLLEDGIVGAQKNKDSLVGPVPDIFDYTFRKMLRGTITAEWGDLLVQDPAAGQEVSTHHTYLIPAGVVIKSTSLVAFISNADTKEVVQAEEKKVP